MRNFRRRSRAKSRGARREGSAALCSDLRDRLPRVCAARVQHAMSSAPPAMNKYRLELLPCSDPKALVAKLNDLSFSGWEFVAWNGDEVPVHVQDRGHWIHMSNERQAILIRTPKPS